jgi:hypothetical protein
LHQTIQQRNAADRHDQLRQTFSLCQSTWFQKYYVKIILGLWIWNRNAYIHINRIKRNAKNTARYDFMESLANALITTDWENFATWSVRLNLQALLQKDQPFRKGHPSVSRKEPNKSNKWRNMSRKQQLIGMCPIFGRRIYE